MDFSFTEEQDLLADSVRRYVRDHYGFEQRRKILAEPDITSRRTWKDFADLGLLGLLVREEEGGLGAGATECLLVSMALGEGLVVEPYLESAVLATRAIECLGSVEQRHAWLPRMIQGDLIVAPAFDRWPGAADGPPVRAVERNGSWQLTGRIPVVYHAPSAGLLLVGACTNPLGQSNDALFAVPVNTEGLSLDSYRSVDEQPAADVELAGARLDGTAKIGGEVTAELSALSDYGVMALCAQGLGVLDRCLTLTVEYSQTRHQFGGPIGRFQALQHRMVDMLTRIEQTRSLIYLAVSRCEDASIARREGSISAAKTMLGEAARFVGQQAVQLHGGMGVCEEVGISHYFKRLLAAEVRFGNAEAHLDRYSAHLNVD